MPNIHFIQGSQHRLDMARQLVEKLYTEGHRLHIFSSDPKRLHSLSQRLWTHDPLSFIAHDWLDECQLQVIPSLENKAKVDTLINLDIHCPPHYAQYDTVYELISEHPHDKQLARERWKMYKQNPNAIVKLIT